MGKSKARLVTAGEQVQGLVDRGYDVDIELKNLSVEDKGIKKMLSDEVSDSFGEDSCIAVCGNKGMATIVRSEKYALKGTAEQVDEIRKAAEEGLLGAAVQSETVLNVPVAERERAAQILAAVGISATTVVELKIDPAAYRVLAGSKMASVEGIKAKEALDVAVQRTDSYRISYSKATA